MPNAKPLIIIGRAEKIYLTDLDCLVPAKVDTGADLSSCWASDIEIVDGKLNFKLFDPSSPFYTGKIIVLPTSNYRLTRIANSFGHKELRYAVKLSVELSGRKVWATFSLSDRSSKLYPILIGRRLLKGKFLVDVSKGDTMHKEEQAKYANLQADLKQMNAKV